MKKHVASLFYCFGLALLAGCAQEPQKKEQRSVNPAADAPATSKILQNRPVVTWLRMNAAAFGCLLEQELHYKDPVFNCSLKGYKNDADPCDESGEYYKGQAFPEKHIPDVHPNLKSITLAFEHGELQELNLFFKSSITKREAKKMLSLPSENEPLPENIIAITYSYPNENNKELIDGVTLVGFEHIGAADVDCAGEDADEE